MACSEEEARARATGLRLCRDRERERGMRGRFANDSALGRRGVVVTANQLTVNSKNFIACTKVVILV